MKTIPTLISFSLLLLLLSSCKNIVAASTTQPAQSQWLQNLACDFPCWGKITPQLTDFNKVTSILREENIPITFENEKEISFQFQSNISGSVQSATNGTVDHIVLVIVAQKTTLGDIVQSIGQPDKVSIVRDLYADTCSVVILFEKKGTILEFSLENHSRNLNTATDCQVDINMSSQVFRVIFIGNKINDSEFWRNASYSDLDYMEWKGYGKYP
jgi:hypothetical protein